MPGYAEALSTVLVVPSYDCEYRMSQRIILWIKDKWGFLWQILQQIHQSPEPVSGIILAAQFGVGGRFLEVLEGFHVLSYKVVEQHIKNR